MAVKESIEIFLHTRSDFIWWSSKLSFWVLNDLSIIAVSGLRTISVNGVRSPFWPIEARWIENKIKVMISRMNVIKVKTFVSFTCLNRIYILNRIGVYKHVSNLQNQSHYYSSIAYSHLSFDFIRFRSFLIGKKNIHPWHIIQTKGINKST